MENHSALFRECLETLDIQRMKKLWRHVSPHLPQPVTDQEVLVSMHMARTASRTVAMKLRYYSHRWLTDNGFPSGLPDPLRPLAERMYPNVAHAVGISLSTKNELLKPLMNEVRGAMEQAVLEAHADGRIQDTPFVKARMLEAKEKTYDKLLGRGSR